MTISSKRFRQILREETKRNLVSTRKPLYESIRGKSFLIIENLSSSELSDKMDTKEGKEEIRKSLWEKFRDNSAVDLGLDLLGLVAGNVGSVLGIPTGGAAPIIAMIPDLLNAARKFARGDKFGGALSLICAIPIAGDAFANYLTASRFSFKGAETTIAVVRSLSTFFKEHGDTARKINTGASAIMKVVAEHLPEAKEHHKDITDAVSSLTSGDQEKIIKVAEKSGAKFDNEDLSKDKGQSKNVDTSEKNDAVTESRRLRNRKLQIVMGR
jgi:hypothetical protein